LPRPSGRGTNKNQRKGLPVGREARYFSIYFPRPKGRG
jgi:hypothetical protein